LEHFQNDFKLLNNCTFIDDQLVSQVAAACLRKAWSYTSQTLPEKMLIPSQDQQLTMHEILPAIWEARDQDEGENGKGLHPRSDVLDAATLFLGLGRQHKSTI